MTKRNHICFGFALFQVEYFNHMFMVVIMKAALLQLIWHGLNLYILQVIHIWGKAFLLSFSVIILINIIFFHSISFFNQFIHILFHIVMSLIIQYIPFFPFHHLKLCLIFLFYLFLFFVIFHLRLYYLSVFVLSYFSF